MIHKELLSSYREGTAQKLKSMALPYKTEVQKKTLIEFYVDGIEIGDNLLGGWHERCSNVSFCYMKARNGQKKAPADRRKWQKTPKSSRNGHSWVEMGRRPYQNDQKNKINKTPIELLRQNH